MGRSAARHFDDVAYHQICPLFARQCFRAGVGSGLPIVTWQNWSGEVYGPKVAHVGKAVAGNRANWTDLRQRSFRH